MDPEEIWGAFRYCGYPTKLRVNAAVIRRRGSGYRGTDAKQTDAKDLSRPVTAEKTAASMRPRDRALGRPSSVPRDH